MSFFIILIDLKSKAYGFVPFCSSRKEMTGYQFWKEGYWKENLSFFLTLQTLSFHVYDCLEGKPYHISALFVVDLDIFRARGVGDQLRLFFISSCFKCLLFLSFVCLIEGTMMRSLEIPTLLLTWTKIFQMQFSSRFQSTPSPKFDMDENILLLFFISFLLLGLAVV